MNKIYVASIVAPVVTPYQGWSPCIKWCEEQLSSSWVYIGEGVFNFSSEHDHLMFLLRWA